eukprot:Em0002g1525a
MRKAVTAEFFTDGWPQFTSIVCSIINPNSKESEVDDSDVDVQLGSFVALGLDEFKEELPQIAKVLAIDDDSITLEWWVGTYNWHMGSMVADIMIYSRCKESVLEILHGERVLERHKDIAKDSTLYFGELDESLAQYLIDSLKSSDGRPLTSDYLYFGSQLYLPLTMHSSIPDRTCPSGYFLGNLQPCHVEYIFSYGKYSSETKAVAETYRVAVSSLPSSAVFLTSNPAYPVAWFLCHTYSHMGHLFTLEEYRRKGLGTLVVKDLCLKLSAEGYILECSSDNPEAIRIFKSIGFVEFQMSRWLLYQQQ